MYLSHVGRALLIAGFSTCLTACAGLQAGNVSKNPVAVPAQLYASSPAAQQATSAEQSSALTANDAALMRQLQFVDDEINRGEYEAALQHLTQLTPTLATNSALHINLIILQTKLALLAGYPKRAIFWLNQLAPDVSCNLAQQHYLLQLRAQALYRTNQVLLSAIANIEDHADSASIWNKLLTIEPAQLQTQPANYPQPVVAGWILLAQIVQRDANNFALLKRNLIAWQQNYPDHPANDLLLMLHTTPPEPSANASVAVILPLSRKYAALGQAVQQGMLSAYYASPTNKEQQLRFYDSNADSIAHIYQRIQENGDTLILGPLTKTDTEALLKVAAKFPKIISLNYTEQSPQSSQFEFGLSPEDEARQVAELAWRQGKSQSIIIAPNTAKGLQTTQAFIKTWNALGGQVIDQYHYAIHDDFSKSLRALLGVTNSNWRQHLVRTRLQLRIKSRPYFRKDADMIFLIADPKLARQIGPFVKFYSGNYLSIFATSSIYEGEPKPNTDKDLNAIYFCDMPALIQATPNTFVGDKRLYFLGTDAYLLAMQTWHLATLPRFALFGNTGNLTVDFNHRIQRGLLCAQFKNGRPTPLYPTD